MEAKQSNQPGKQGQQDSPDLGGSDNITNVGWEGIVPIAVWATDEAGKKWAIATHGADYENKFLFVRVVSREDSDNYKVEFPDTDEEETLLDEELVSQHLKPPSTGLWCPFHRYRGQCSCSTNYRTPNTYIRHMNTHHAGELHMLTPTEKCQGDSVVECKCGTLRLSAKACESDRCTKQQGKYDDRPGPNLADEVTTLTSLMAKLDISDEESEEASIEDYKSTTLKIGHLLLGVLEKAQARRTEVIALQQRISALEKKVGQVHHNQTDLRETISKRLTNMENHAQQLSLIHI